MLRTVAKKQSRNEQNVWKKQRDSSSKSGGEKEGIEKLFLFTSTKKQEQSSGRDSKKMGDFNLVFDNGSRITNLAKTGLYIGPTRKMRGSESHVGLINSKEISRRNNCRFAVRSVQKKKTILWVQIERSRSSFGSQWIRMSMLGLKIK